MGVNYSEETVTSCNIQCNILTLKGLGIWLNDVKQKVSFFSLQY